MNYTSRGDPGESHGFIQKRKEKFASKFFFNADFQEFFYDNIELNWTELFKKFDFKKKKIFPFFYKEQHSGAPACFLRGGGGRGLDFFSTGGTLTSCFILSDSKKSEVCHSGYTNDVMLVYSGAVIRIYFLIKIVQKKCFLLQSITTLCSLLRMMSRNDGVSSSWKFLVRERSLERLTLIASCWAQEKGEKSQKKRRGPSSNKTRQGNNRLITHTKTALGWVEHYPGGPRWLLSPIQTPNWRGRRSVVTGPVFDGWTSVMSPYFTVIKRQSPTWSHYEGPDQSTPLDLDGDQRAHAAERSRSFFPHSSPFVLPTRPDNFSPAGQRHNSHSTQIDVIPPAESYIHNPHECHR